MRSQSLVNSHRQRRWFHEAVSNETVTRREACKLLAGAVAATSITATPITGARLLAAPPSFRLRYILASSMYGTMKLAEILPEVREIGAEHIDIWPRVHGNQREQVEAMGHAHFAALLAEHEVKLGILTRFDLGPFRLQREIRVLKKLGARLIVCGSGGPKNLKAGELKAAVKSFAARMKPSVELAEENDITIGIENHGRALIRSPDSQRWFVDEVRSKHIGIALAPYHLPQSPSMIARLIEDLGPGLAHFYAWQYGKGCSRKLPKEEELLQMPGRGSLDFKPLLAALERIEYQGWTEVFMHPVPRGIPILGTAAKVTTEINRARRHLEESLGNG